jgi:hypothetical protein
MDMTSFPRRSPPGSPSTSTWPAACPWPCPCRPCWSPSLGGLLLGVAPTPVLIPLLVVLLLASAVRVWRHRQGHLCRSEAVSGAMREPDRVTWAARGRVCG